MWRGILALAFYYVGYFIIYITEGTSPNARFLGRKLIFYGNLALFIILPLSLLFAIWAILKGLFSLEKDKGAAPKMNLACGVITICLFGLSIFLFFVDALSFGGSYIFFGIPYPIFLVFVAGFIVYLYYIFRKKMHYAKT